MPNYSYINMAGYRLKVGSWLFQDFRWSMDKKHQRLVSIGDSICGFRMLIA